jgi:hypothetical protein
MIRFALLAGVLATPPVTGALAPILSLAALGVPTALLSFDHSLPAGACCTTYFPFVLLTALFVGPVYATLVGIGSAGLADALFMGPRYQLFESPMDSFGDVSSLVSFALIIGCVSLYRWVITRRAHAQVSADSTSGIIFSLEKGVASASLPGSEPVPLGPQDEVAEMMRDFLAQIELAERFAKRSR